MNLIPFSIELPGELPVGSDGSAWVEICFWSSGYTESLEFVTDVVGNFEILTAQLDGENLALATLLGDIVSGKIIFRPGDKLRLDLRLPIGTLRYKVVLKGRHIINWNEIAEYRTAHAAG